jgi:hypothetical protein
MPQPCAPTPKPWDVGARESECRIAAEHLVSGALERAIDAGWERREMAVAMLRAALAEVNRLYPPMLN